MGVPRLVGEPARFLDLLRQEADGDAVALGVDLPIGVPRTYAALRPEPGFLAFLETIRNWPEFFLVCSDWRRFGRIVRFIRLAASRA
jgi:hypothetical protein